jgi:hypothetical protein
MALSCGDARTLNPVPCHQRAGNTSPEAWAKLEKCPLTCGYIIKWSYGDSNPGLLACHGTPNRLPQSAAVHPRPVWPGHSSRTGHLRSREFTADGNQFGNQPRTGYRCCPIDRNSIRIVDPWLSRELGRRGRGPPGRAQDVVSCGRAAGPLRGSGGARAVPDMRQQ